MSLLITENCLAQLVVLEIGICQIVKDYLVGDGCLENLLILFNRSPIVALSIVIVARLKTAGYVLRLRFHAVPCGEPEKDQQRRKTNPI